ncbi:MAG: RNA polymerase sigma factor [Phycisphaerales bacterium]
MAIHLDELDLARDRDLVERYQGGDERAFEALFVRYFPPLHRHCWNKVGDPGVAEEIAQEAFVKALRALPSFAGERRFYPWLLIIANRLCIDHHRRGQRVTPRAELDPGVVIDVQDLVVERAEAEQLHLALGRIRDRHRKVLKLRDWDGLSYAEIAKELGISEPTVNALLFRARQALRREYLAVSGSGAAAVVPGLAAMAQLWRTLRHRLAQWAQVVPDPSLLAAPLAAATISLAGLITPLIGPPAAPALPPLRVVPAAEVVPAPVGDAPAEPEPGTVPAPLADVPTGAAGAKRGPAVAPTVEGGPAEVFVGPEGAEQGREEAEGFPISTGAGPAFLGIDPDRAAADVVQGLTSSLRQP